MDLKIDQEAVLDLAAEKVAKAILGEDIDLGQMLEDRIEAFVQSTITDEARASMVEKIDAALHAEVEKVLSAEIVPVDIWGEGLGEPTTIRQQLHKRCMTFWEERVEPDRNNPGRYRATSYGGKPRHQHVFQSVCQEAFDKAMQDNVAVMVKAFRDAIVKDTQRAVADNIDKLIKAPTTRR